MSQRDIDNRAIIAPELAQLRTTLQGALQQFGTDEQLRRALMHADSVVADRLGERRSSRAAGSLANRATRRRSG